MSLADELLADLEDEAESMKNDNAAVVAMDVGPIEEGKVVFIPIKVFNCSINTIFKF